MVWVIYYTTCEMAEEEKTDILPKSPTLGRIALEHKIEIENNEQEKTWKSCCGLQAHSEPIQYFTTIAIISGIMVFCIYKLNTNESCESTTAYMGLLTLLLGLVSPSPVF